MTTTRTHESFGDDEKEEVSVRITIGTKTVQKSVKKGTRVKAVLKTLDHKEAAGLTYRLNGRLLTTNTKTHELMEDPVLEENAVLVIQQTFTGGKRQKVARITQRSIDSGQSYSMPPSSSRNAVDDIFSIMGKLDLIGL